MKKGAISFTEIIYSVVIGVAITRIENLQINQQHVLLVLALTVIIDDYIYYVWDVEGKKVADSKPVLMVWLDMLVLGIWYLTLLAAKYSVASFFLYIAIFYLATSIWNTVFYKGRILNRIMERADFFPLGLSLGLSLAAYSVGGAYWIYVVVFISGFILCRFPLWKEISVSSSLFTPEAAA